MGIEVLALSLPSPASQWEQLSSSHQASSRSVIEMGNLELGSTTLAQSRSFSSGPNEAGQKALMMSESIPPLVLNKKRKIKIPNIMFRNSSQFDIGVVEGS